jgi:hypothetical protein
VSVPYNATGAWPSANFGEAPKYCSGVRGEVHIEAPDREVLRRLSGKVRELASRSWEREKRELWYEHNALRSRIPLILVDPENGWNEIIPADTLQCRGGLARRWEIVLRKEICYGESLRDDKPIEALFEIGHTYTESGFGVEETYHGGVEGQSYAWEPAIHGPADLAALQYPRIEVDQETTRQTLDLAREVVGDLLQVRLRDVWWWSLGMTWDLSKLVGLQQLLILVYDDPQLLHRLMAFLRNANLAKLDYLEAQSLLCLNNDHSYVGSGGLGYSRELPRRELGGAAVRTADLWGFTESQETTGLSPQMFKEFVFQYQRPIQERFSLNCYGCCEPLDPRWQVVRKIPNLRRVSVSPWADQRKMSEALADRIIYSRKPSPAPLAVAHLDENLVRKDIRDTLEITRGNVVELIMKDNHTLGHNPQNLVDWVRIAREEIERLYA